MTCTPSGIPSGERPLGTLMVGSPSRLQQLWNEGSPPPSVAGKAQAVEDRISVMGMDPVVRAWAERREKFLFAAMLIVALARCLWEADRQMGFDELFTYYIARLGSIAEIVRAVPADGNPPLYYLLAHATHRLVDQPELAIRLPSVAAFAVTLLCVHRFV